MGVKRFLDTNILLYAYDRDAGRKREVAAALLVTAFKNPAETAVSVQVLQEFHVNFVRAGHPPHEAAALIDDFAAFRVVDNNLALLRSGLEQRTRWQLSLWDAMVLAAARHCGARELCSEDFNHGQDYGGVRVVNPFRPGSA